jgi:ABC-type uncharacterized transport system YnjBCD ATPase subunit
VLRVQDLVLGYGEVAAVEKVSLEVSSGKFVSLVGPSGSGKTSILRAINGLLMPRSGRVELDGGQESLGFLFQDDALLPWRTADENVALGLRIRKMSKSAALAEADSWLNRLGLEGLSNRYPHELSGGQRKRVAIAQVLALKPKLVDRVRTLGGGRRILLREVYIPSVTAWVLGSLKVAVGFAFTGAVVGEFVAATRGLGYLLQFAQSTYNAALTLGLIFLIMTFVLLLFIGAEAVEQRL